VCRLKPPAQKLGGKGKDKFKHLVQVGEDGNFRVNMGRRQGEGPDPHNKNKMGTEASRKKKDMNDLSKATISDFGDRWGGF